jgi:hypothetical protein
MANVAEQSPEVIDTAMERLGGTVLRRPSDEVEAEIAGAETAARRAARKAHEELAQARRERNREEIRAKLDGLKARLHPHKVQADQ